MIEQLKSASEELRTAWHQYFSLCSAIDDHYRLEKVFPVTHDKIARQLDVEITFLSSYETEIKRARATISQVRNYSLSSINKLPSEILARIFHLLLLGRRDANPIPTYSGYFEYNYPDYLAQVCSRWRRIATSCPSLWTYIDVSLDSSHPQRLARVEARAERSEKLPLIVSIDDRKYSFEGYRYNIYTEFWKSVADRVGTLHLHLNDSIHEVSSSALQKIALNPSQGVLHRLAIDASSGGFITPQEEYKYSPNPSPDNDHNWYSRNDLRVEVSKSDLETKFAGITVLHLRGCYPVWTSTAYHGLVDLRLHSVNNRFITITESQLVAILQSSPKMQILHFEVLFITGSDTHAAPVPLNDLEVVRISSSHGYERPFELNDILRLFAPGSKSLRVTLEVAKEEEAVRALQELFVHSKVERLCIKGLYSRSGQFLQVCLTPDLKILALDSCDLAMLAEKLCPSYLASAAASNLVHWYFGSTRTERDNLQLMMNAFPNRIFADKHCTVCGKSDTSSWEGGVKGIFPVIEEIDEDFVGNLVAGWDILD